MPFTALNTSNIAAHVPSQWISGTGYPRFRVSYSYNRTHNKANFRVEQLVREAGKLFHGELTIRLHESNKRVTDKRKNRVRGCQTACV